MENRSKLFGVLAAAVIIGSTGYAGLAYAQSDDASSVKANQTNVNSEARYERHANHKMTIQSEIAKELGISDEEYLEAHKEMLLDVLAETFEESNVSNEQYQSFKEEVENADNMRQLLMPGMPALSDAEINISPITFLDAGNNEVEKLSGHLGLTMDEYFDVYKSVELDILEVRFENGDLPQSVYNEIRSDLEVAESFEDMKYPQNKPEPKNMDSIPVDRAPLKPLK